MKQLINKNTLYIILCVLVAIHPFVELDYLIYDFLNTYHIPRITTIVDYIFYPILIVFCLIVYKDNKKKTTLIIVCYLFAVCVYFIFHNKCSISIINKLNLPDNYYYSVHDELFYTLGFAIPLIYILVFRLIGIGKDSLKKIVSVLSFSISLPIIISDLFVFGYSTYVGKTLTSFFGWFSLPFDGFDHDPRFYACKFFFEEGNTIGILLIIILPFVYYYFLKEDNKKLYGTMAFLQSLAMIILSTRVASLGTVLVPLAMLVIYIVLICLKYETFNKKYIMLLVGIIVLSSAIIPFCPAIQNQLVDSGAYDVQKEILENEYSEAYANYLLIKDSDDKDLLIREFETHKDFVKVTPPIYYEDWYSYEHDPFFWCNLMYEYPLDSRVDGRQIQRIFTNEKLSLLTKSEKLSGLGYSTFMHGGIVIEKDFLSQNYYLGYLGFAILMLPWILITVFLGIKLLIGYRSRRWTYINIIMLMSLVIGLGSAYMSGHAFDQMSVSMVMAIIISVLNKGLEND